jgi:hypothetical protein
MLNSTPAKLFLSESQPEHNSISFGKPVYTLIMPEDRSPGTKLNPRASARRVVGYGKFKGAVRVLNLVTKRVKVTAHWNAAVISA